MLQPPNRRVVRPNVGRLSNKLTSSETNLFPSQSKNPSSHIAFLSPYSNAFPNSKERKSKDSPNCKVKEQTYFSPALEKKGSHQLYGGKNLREDLGER